MSQLLRRRGALFLPFLLVVLVGERAHAQQSDTTTMGTIAGIVIDKLSAGPLEGVAIQVVGFPALGGTTNDKGRYTITRIPAGTITLQLRRVGYRPLTVTGILLAPGKTLQQDAAMEQMTVVLEPMVVSSFSASGTVVEALSTQRAAPGVVNSVTAEQIQRSTDGDAASAVQRTSGITLQDGAPVARGQDGRGTTAFLNSARIPSPEPEKKQVPLDIIPSPLIRAINVYKTFTPNQPGDFSGALVDIQTREFPAQRTVTYSFSIGFNSAARSNVLAGDLAPSEWFGFASGRRSLPSLVREAGNFTSRPYTQGEMNDMIGTFRNSWTPREHGGALNGSFGMTMGDNTDLLGRQFGYIATLSYSTSQEVRNDEYRALIDLGTGRDPTNEYRGSTGRLGVLWGGLLNFSTFLSDTDILTFNNTYTRTSDSEARRDVGRDESLGLENILQRSTLSYVERSVRSNQVSGKHRLSGRSALDWSVTNAGVTRREPDRADMVYISTLDAASRQQNPFVLLTWHPDGARRTFADLTEQSWNAATNYKWEFLDSNESTLQFGASYRYTHRRSGVLQYSFSGLRPLSIEEGSQRAEDIFDGRHTQGEERVFTINPLGQNGSYQATDHVGAAYAMADYSLSDRLRLVAGARGEFNWVNVSTEGSFAYRVSATKDFLDLLPAVALNIKLSETQNLRLSATRTLARPEYRELSPMLNRDVLGGQGFQGDTSLVRTLIDNLDARWEWYPSAGEVVSVALFAKRHKKPLEKVEVPTSGAPLLSFVNAEKAYNYGAEFELRKELGSVLAPLAPFTLFSNVTLMRSEVRLAPEDAASATNASRALAGQAPYVLNNGISYTAMDGDLSATVLHNRVGKRTSAAGSNPLPDIHEMPRDQLDIALRFPAILGVGVKVDIRNVLDSPIELRQGEVTRLRYRSGSAYTVGLSWKTR